MSGFKENLDAELEKRSKTAEAPVADSRPSKPSIFSFKSFFVGVIICGLLFTGLALWAKLSAPKTIVALQNKLPSKTTIVEFVETGAEDTVLTIPEVRSPEPTPDDAEQSADTSGEMETVDNIEPAKVMAPQEVSQAPETTKEKPYKLYRVDFSKKTDKPLLSIIVTDIGLSKNRADQIISDFPEQVSFSMSPYTRGLKSVVKSARKDGHEVWLTLPLETKEYPLNDSGPSTLLVNTSTEKNQARLKDVMKSSSDYVGFISPYNHVFKAEDANVNPFIKEIFRNGYAMIDGNNSSRSFISGLADRNSYPYAQNEIWLDNNLGPLTLNKNIRLITEYGENGRDVIVMLRPYPASLQAMQKFLKSRAVEAFELAPASAQLKNK